MNTPLDSSLGRRVEYPTAYDAALLFPIARADGRAELGLAPGADLPFHGVDIWNAYELSWLDLRGKPRVALAEFRVPATSPRLIESKSWKLYLNSLSAARFESADAVRALLARDLSAAAGAPVGVMVMPPASSYCPQIEVLSGECIDDMPIAVEHYGPPKPELLAADAERVVTESLVSHLLKSNCPVTGQPDWASVQISYTGPRIDRAGLLRYLISFRDHSGFHEQCVDRIFVDLQRRCLPKRLGVYARYTRRGGLDINPFRTNVPGAAVENPRTVRQ